MLLVTLPVMAQVYKYTDENGIVHYTNVKPAGNVRTAVLNFPCYASDPKCRSVDWNRVPLNTRAFRNEIDLAAENYALDAALIRAIIHAESAYQVDAVSPKGAQGLMQLMPATAQDLEVSDPFNASGNIDGGARYLAALLDEFDSNIELAAAAYNAGPNAVKKYQGVPPYNETKEYVRRIRILYSRYRQQGS